MQLSPLVAPGADLTDAEVRRYARHLILPEVGRQGQRRLKNARVLMVGAGGLGSPGLLYLAAAGVGTIGIIDFDVVDESNLHRQVIHGTGDIGRPKVESAAEAVARVNPLVRVVRHEERLDSATAPGIIEGYDLVVDGTDNFPTRYLVNDVCGLLGKPYVWASIFRFDGQLSVFWAGRGPCYRCLFPTPPPPGAVPSCAEGGVLGVLPGLLGTAQANEAIKLIVGMGEPLVGRVAIHDSLRATWQQIGVRADPRCVLCGEKPTVTEPIDYVEFCAGPAALADDGPLPEVSPRELAALLTSDEDFTLVDVREPHEREINRIEGAVGIPKGLFETGEAWTLLPDGPLILHCKSGGRSAQVLRTVTASGRDARHLAGGIDAWIDEIQPELARY